ncbi:hypothetical protein LJB83_01295 [Clostridia bacterium OttesenSCG-928-F22]|nr:hypothetical protein [Clostridia bacterium OttesenSCG-928-F22]
MANRFGANASIVTLTAVVLFAFSMLIGSNFLSYLSSIFIALGFVPMVCAHASRAGQQHKAAAYTAIGFAAVYCVLIFIVYFTQLTVDFSTLSAEATALLDYSKFGLFFSLDLLGYAFMALSTFFISLTLQPKDRGDKWLKRLLAIHGIFAITCFVMPMLGIFKPDMPGGDLTGTLVLEFWCLYFAPICILSARYFRKAREA